MRSLNTFSVERSVQACDCSIRVTLSRSKMDAANKLVEETNDNVTEDCQLTLRLLELVRRTRYELVQENGQRRLTSPEIIRGEKLRTKGAEIFLGRLPRDCYEDELMPILEKVGSLMELRLMLDFSGATRGYAFALFENCKVAKRACKALDGYEIRPGKRIGVVKSLDNCRLFFGGVPKDKSKEEFMLELSKILDGIIDIYVYPSAHDKASNRGFLFVEFKDHRAAAMARRKLIPGKVTLWDHEIAVDWADPEPGEPVDDEIMNMVTALFVRNLSLDMSQRCLRETIQRATGVPILKLKKINHFAFIHYENRQAAQVVLNIMCDSNGIATCEGWEIRWAKPIGPSRLSERQRCIEEAAAKITVRRKREKRLETEKHGTTEAPLANSCEENEASGSNGHVSWLQDVIRDALGAECTFECLRLLGVCGYTCKITVKNDDTQLFVCQGELMRTKYDAITVAAAQLHHFLMNTYLSPSRQIGIEDSVQETGDCNGTIIGLPHDLTNSMSNNLQTQAGRFYANPMIYAPSSMTYGDL